MSDAVATARTPRHRVNIKETAKGVCQVDCTAEYEDSGDAVDAAVTLLSDTRTRLKELGRQLSDE